MLTERRSLPNICMSHMWPRCKSTFFTNTKHWDFRSGPFPRFLFFFYTCRWSILHCLILICNVIKARVLLNEWIVAIRIVSSRIFQSLLTSMFWPVFCTRVFLSIKWLGTLEFHSTLERLCFSLVFLVLLWYTLHVSYQHILTAKLGTGHAGAQRWFYLGFCFIKTVLFVCNIVDVQSSDILVCHLFCFHV